MEPKHSRESALQVEPECVRWMELIRRTPSGSMLGRSQEQWREITRRELGLDTSRPIIATGHQTLLWHPGILAKYLVMEGAALGHDLATANLVVDQHAEGFGDFEIPFLRGDGALAARRIELCRPRPRKDVPMGHHEAFTPPRPPKLDDEVARSVAHGVTKIFDAVYAHRTAPNAAMQMARALAELMKPWVRPMVDVTSTALVNTSLGQAMMRAMADDPWRCAECYNRAVSALPEAGIGLLLIRDDYVELPLWRIREDGRRMHAYDSDVEASQGDGESKVQNPDSQITLMPRALFMTALVRLGMCDLFIHGTGGANYDRAMELWIRQWLGVEVGPIAVATADVRLPLMENDSIRADLNAATHEARRLWHDPMSDEGSEHPSDRKAALLKDVDERPRKSPQRRAAFTAMHEQLSSQRTQREEAIKRAQDRVKIARRMESDGAIAHRRDWAFPLYPKESIDELAAAARDAATCGQ